MFACLTENTPSVSEKTAASHTHPGRIRSSVTMTALICIRLGVSERSSVGTESMKSGRGFDRSNLINRSQNLALASFRASFVSRREASLNLDRCLSEHVRLCDSNREFGGFQVYYRAISQWAKRLRCSERRPVD